MVRCPTKFFFDEYGTEELSHMLVKIGHDWNFDMWHVTDWGKHPVVLSGQFIMKQYDVSILDEAKLLNFLYDLEKAYKINPYHNMTHAADVMANLIYIIQNSDLLRFCTMNDILCCIVAALGHDVGHPGMTNRYLIAVKDELALTYNDQSVLENMHCSITFDTLLKKENAILEHLPSEEWALVRKIIVTLILGTDMAKHFDLVV